MTKIAEYDKELLEDIEHLKQYISEEEELAKDFMRASGAPEKTIEQVVQKGRIEGRPISSDGSGGAAFRILKFLEEMISAYKAFPFRVWTRWISFQSPETHVISENEWLIFNTCPLNNEDRRNYAEHWQATRKLNYGTDPQNLAAPVATHKCHPTLELMRFIAKMLTKYNANQVLARKAKYDEKMGAIWKELFDKEWEQSDAARYVEKVRTLREHLEQRGYSPVPSSLISATMRAIALAKQEKWHNLVMLPYGVEWPVAKVIKELRLESFLT